MTTYSNSLKLALIGDGEQTGVWGATTNTNLGTLLEQAICYQTSISMSGGSDYTLSDLNGAADEARSAAIIIGGVQTGTNAVICPAKQKLYIITNNLASSATAYFKPAGGTAISIINGTTVIAYCTGSTMVAVNYVDSAYSSLLAAGAANLTGGSANAIPYQSGAGATTYLVPGTSGYVLTSGGSGAAPYWNPSGTATLASNIAGGSAGQVVYQSGPNATNFVSAGSTGQLLTSNGTGAPSWTTLTGATQTGNNTFSGINSFTNATPVTFGAAPTISGYSVLTTNTGGQLSGTNSWTGQNTFTGTTSFSATVLPTSDGIYNLGSTSLRWNQIYSQGITNGQTGNNVGGLNLAAGAVALNFSAYTSIFGNNAGISVAVDNGAGGYKIALGIGNNGKTVSVGGAGAAATWGFYSSLNNIGASGICGVFDASLYSGSSAIACQSNSTSTAMAGFFYGPAGSGVSVGTISTNGSSVAYNTTSDYRLKENVQPLAGAVSRVKALRPVTYNWIGTETTGEGFIAHELQAVVPDAVNGEKDAVDEDGKIKPQAIDPSKIVATLTAALQEAIARIEVLEAKVGA